MKIICEIHRRFVWQAVLIYTALCWLVLFGFAQAMGFLLDQEIIESLEVLVGLHEIARTVLTLGLPLVAVTAYLQGAERSGSEKEGSSSSFSSLSDNLAAGTGSLDRRSTRPSLVYRLLTWRNLIRVGIAFLICLILLAVGLTTLESWLNQEAPL